MRKAILALAAVPLLSACATMDGVGARMAASDVSIIDAALFIHRTRGASFDPSEFSDRVVLYRAIDTVARLRRGEITDADAAAEVDALLLEVEQPE